MRLDAILQYGMNDIEAKAYKICIFWEDILNHECPGYRTERLSKGDPRKSFLFRCARKLINETQGLLPEDMYKYYVYAQITSLKNYSDGKIHALIEPPCLFGNTAWIRWKIWKAKFDKMKMKEEHLGTTNLIFQNEKQVISELQKTKEFLETKITIDVESIEKSINDKSIQKWASFNKISPYFLIISKTIKNKIIDMENYFGFEPSLYRKSITTDIIEEYEKIFGNI